MSRKNHLKALTLAALFAAFITVFTAFLFHIPINIGQNTAYLHFGDAFVFIAASLLPTPFAVGSAAFGGLLADVFCGAAVWAPFTFVIKGLVALCFTSKKDKMLCGRNCLAMVLALIITVAGYYIAEALLYGNWVAPALSVFGNVVQIAGSSAIYVVLALAMQRAGLKKNLGE